MKLTLHLVRNKLRILEAGGISRILVPMSRHDMTGVVLSRGNLGWNKGCFASILDIVAVSVVVVIVVFAAAASTATISFVINFSMKG